MTNDKSPHHGLLSFLGSFVSHAKYNVQRIHDVAFVLLGSFFMVATL
jgi:hypothetical protein